MADMILALAAIGVLLALAVPADTLERFGVARVRAAVYGGVAGVLAGLAILPLLGLAAAVVLLGISVAVVGALVVAAYLVWRALVRR